MRLPFLQLAEKFITVQSKVVARMLGIDRVAVIGMGTLLFETAVELTSSDEAPPTGIILGEDAVDIIEAGMEWHGERGKAFAAFVRADVIERLETGARVKGCDRYRDAWAKQQRRRDSAKVAAAARWGSASCETDASASQSHNDASQSHAPRNAQTETYTYTYKKERELERAPEVPVPDPAVVLDVYAHYRQVFRRRHAEPSALERDCIAARLREGFESEELKKAVTGLSRSKFHRDKAHEALKYALGDRDAVERCMRWADNPPDIGPAKGRASEADRDWSLPVQVDAQTGEVVL